MDNKIVNNNNNNNMITAGSVHYIDVSKLSQNELEYIQNQINERRFNEISENIKRLKLENDEIKNKQNDIENNQNKIFKDLNVLDEKFDKYNTLSFSAGHRKIIKKKAGGRVTILLGDTSTYMRILLGRQFFAWIYKDVGIYMNVGDYNEISLSNYQDENSDFQKALNYISKWIPKEDDYKDKMIKIEDNFKKGLLSTNMAIAASHFLVSEERKLLENIIYHKST